MQIFYKGILTYDILLVSGVHHSDLIFLDIENDPQLSLVNICHHQSYLHAKSKKGLWVENQVNVRGPPSTHIESESERCL